MTAIFSPAKLEQPWEQQLPRIGIIFFHAADERREVVDDQNLLAGVDAELVIASCTSGKRRLSTSPVSSKSISWLIRVKFSHSSPKRYLALLHQLGGHLAVEIADSDRFVPAPPTDPVFAHGQSRARLPMRATFCRRRVARR